MIVKCPKCKTRYNFDEERIGATGIKVRCSRCQHVFEVSKAATQAVEETVNNNVFSTAPSCFDEHDADADKHFVETGTLLDTNEDGAAPRKKKHLLSILVLVFLLLIGVGFAAYYFAPTLLGNARSSSVAGKKVDEQKNATEKIVPEISLKNVRQYFVKNEKIGQICVVEGKAVNAFKVPKELIRLQIKLFDKAGKTIQTKEFYCGNVISYFQLQVLNLEELESALSAKVGILTNNTHLQPGGEVPFMVVFPNPPETLQEFGLDAIEAKDPPAAS